MIEEWRPTMGGKYEVSSAGRIRRIAGGKGAIPGAILRTSRHKGHYPCIRRWDGSTKKRHTVYVHALVAEAFLGSRPDGYVVNHKNSNRHDNRVENLEWASVQQNCQHTWKVGRALSPFKSGEQHIYAKLDSNAVLSIRQRRASGEGPSVLAREYGVAVSTICGIVSRRKWRHI